jgi:hypothetical protein
MLFMVATMAAEWNAPDECVGLAHPAYRDRGAAR